MLIVTCTKCDGWIVVVADETKPSPFLDAARDEGRKPHRRVIVTGDVYDERAFGLTGACRASYGKRPDRKVSP